MVVVVVGASDGARQTHSKTGSPPKRKRVRGRRGLRWLARSSHTSLLTHHLTSPLTHSGNGNGGQSAGIVLGRHSASQA